MEATDNCSGGIEGVKSGAWRKAGWKEERSNLGVAIKVRCGREGFKQGSRQQREPGRGY